MTATDSSRTEAVADDPPRPGLSPLIGWRERLAAAVFPAPATSAGPRRTGRFLLAFLAATAYLLLIPAGRTRLNHVWAEDGARFLVDALTQPFGTTLITPYGGYSHSVPRLAAGLVALLPLPWAAAALAISAAALRAGIALLVFTASRGVLRSTPIRVALAALVIVIPAGNWETINNLTNLHWFVLYGAFWVLLWRPAHRWQQVLTAVVLFLASTTSPIALILTPLAVARFALPRRDWWGGCGFLAGLLLQALAVLGSTRTPYSDAPADLPAAAVSALVRGPLSAVAGPEWAMTLYQRFHLLAAVAALLVVVVLVVPALAPGLAPRRFLAVAALVCAAVSMGLELVMNWTPVLHVDAPGVLGAGQRYSAAPCLFLLAAVAAGVDALRGRRLIPVVRVAVALVLLAGVAHQYRTPYGRLGGVPWGQTVADATIACAQGQPEATLRHDPDGWYFPLPCPLP
ncbi:hypothetical protein [Goodfellowiella coeruleoviolacea]|uniref:Uncharacterized protein n=1 Tax=Goodfellowiella coeruleoviolacea TaxID=334858 RepID=A0AAE3KIP6_9PSEU|nr:hypothetical protein [Goodfellowiella coeruleoviolacea]MCP2168217.1 hypothetical protein [Goodfellowiella coeruleoviolacea]